MKKEYLEIGKIVNVHGLQGEVKVIPWCDEPDFLCEFSMLYIGKDRREVNILRSRVSKNAVIMKIEGYDTPEKAEKLRGQVLYIHRDDVELEEGCYFIQDLFDIKVVDVDSGVVYGLLKDVLQTGANDVYDVRSEDGKQYLIPAIPDVIIETDLDAEIMRIRPLEGLFDAN